MNRPEGAPRAVADPNRGLILAAVEVEAPLERAFAALTTSELTQWWGSPDTFRVIKFTADLRKGGAWRHDGLSADGNPFTTEGDVVEIDPPRLLVQTCRYQWGSTTIRYQLDPILGGSRVTVWHEGFAGQSESCARHVLAWEAVLGGLRDHFARGGRPPA